jgi:hypothetical protein
MSLEQQSDIVEQNIARRIGIFDIRKVINNCE